MHVVNFLDYIALIPLSDQVFSSSYSTSLVTVKFVVTITLSFPLCIVPSSVVPVGVGLTFRSRKVSSISSSSIVPPSICDVYVGPLPPLPPMVPEPGCRYPLLLRFAVFVGVVRTMKDLREGSETTIMAMHISAVHHASGLELATGAGDGVA
jgi:hypothetical protein